MIHPEVAKKLQGLSGSIALDRHLHPVRIPNLPTHWPYSHSQEPGLWNAAAQGLILGADAV